MDANGFFLDGSSRITLANFTIDGSVHGTGDIGGDEAIMLAGVANASGNFTLDLIPASLEGRYRTDTLWTDPTNFLRVDVEGDAHLALDFAIGPAVMTWEGLYQVTTDDVHAIDVQLDEMLLNGQVSLPELKQVVHGVPQDGFVTIEAVYQSGPGTWHIDATAETSAIYQLGGLTIRQLDFDADIGPNLLDGDFSALMEVPFGETEDPLVIDIDLDFNSRELSGMMVASFAERYVGGTLLWLQGAQLTTNVDVQFDQQSLLLDFTTTVDRAILFVDPVEAPGVAPTGVATLTGVTGTLSRDGVLDFRLDHAVAEFPAFTITASGAGDNPAMHLVIDPDQVDDTVVLATVSHAVLTLPSLTGSPETALQDLQIRRNGLHIDSLKIGGNDGFDASLTNILQVTDMIVEMQDFTLVVAGPARTLTGEITVSADSATLFPSVGATGLAQAGNLSGSLDVASGALSVSASQIATAFVPSVGGVLPLQIDNVGLIVADLRDPDTFEASVTGRFDFSPFLPDLGFTPTLKIDGVEITAAQSFTLELSSEGLRGSLAHPVHFGPITLGITGLTIPGTDTVLDGELTIGRLGADGVPQPIPDTDAQVAGFATVTGGSQFPADLRIDLLGTVTLHADGSSTVAVAGLAALDFDENGDPIVGGAAARFTFQIDATPLAEAPFLALQVQAELESVTLDDIVFDLSPAIHIAVGQVSYFNEPAAGDPVAELLDVVVSFPSFPEWGDSTIASIFGYDDNDDGVIDGFQIVDASLDLTGVVNSAGAQLLQLTDFVLSIPSLSFRDGALTGEIIVLANSATLFPGAELTAAIVDNPDTAAPALQGSIDLATGAVALTVDRLLASLGGGVEFEANVGLLQFAPNDADDALAVLRTNGRVDDSALGEKHRALGGRSASPAQRPILPRECRRRGSRRRFSHGAGAGRTLAAGSPVGDRRRTPRAAHCAEQPGRRHHRRGPVRFLAVRSERTPHADY